MTDPLSAFAIHVATAVTAVGVALGLAALLRERAPVSRASGPYESGILPRGDARGPRRAPFFLIAAFFVIFDMEAALLFAWAVAAREVGASGLVEAAVFIGVLLAALVYLWGEGALDWGPDARGGAVRR